MDQQASDLTALNQLYTLNGVLQGMLLNIALIESGTIGQVISVTNANLYQIAAVQYGDATQWTTIANANGLSDPFIEATITVAFLPAPPNPTLTFTGIPISPQTIILTVNTIVYVYNVSAIDTLASIATNIANLIPGGFAINNTIIFPSGFIVDPKVLVQRIVNLVIPQQPGLPSGGILSS